MSVIASLRSALRGGGSFDEVGGGLDKMQRLFGSRGAARETMTAAKTIAMKRTLAYYQGQIRRNIRSGGKLAGAKFKKLSDVTKKIKGSSKPLIDTGDMMASVTPIFIDEDVGFVGLKRGETHKKGGQVVDIAEIHEFGAIVKNHEVPARPFIGPVNKKFKKAAGRIYLKAIAKVINER